MLDFNVKFISFPKMIILNIIEILFHSLLFVWYELNRKFLSRLIIFQFMSAHSYSAGHVHPSRSQIQNSYKAN